MIKSAFWIGFYSFLEAIRSRFLFGIFLLILPIMISPWLLDVYQIGFQVKIVKDLGFNLISGFGLLIVLFLSLDQIIPDIEKKSIYFVLTRNSNRQAYILGRFLGVSSTLLFFHSLMVGLLLLLLRFHDGAWFWEIPLGAFAIFLKQSVLVSIVLMFATFTTKIVVISLGVLTYVLGHGMDILRMLIEKKGIPALSSLLEMVVFFLPDFSLYELRIMVVHEVQVSFYALLLLAFYSLMISLFYLAVGGKILAQRDL